MSKGQRAGRPRDPGVEPRAMQAARAVYTERGWSGFSLDEVARRSGIGKGSLYLRWPGKASLLIDAVRERIGFIAAIDTGTLRGDLIEFSCRWRDYLCSEEGVLLFRLNIDARYAPDLAAGLADDPYPQYIRDTRAIIRRGIERGELPSDTSVALVGDLIAGAITNHIHTTPPELREAEAPDYVETLVDAVLAGVQAS